MSAPAPISLSCQLPPNLRRAWARVEMDATGLLGRTRSINSLVARHHGTFEVLIDGGLRHEDLVALLAEAGITRADGSKITRNAIAAAISRGRRSPRSNTPPIIAGLGPDPAPLPQVCAQSIEPLNQPLAGPDPPGPVAPHGRWPQPTAVKPSSRAAANLRAGRLFNRIGQDRDHD